MKEFVIVKFPDDRLVSVDRIPMKKTNKKFTVETGHHTFDLALPFNYTPRLQTLLVELTSADSPLEIVFEKIVAARAGRKKVAKSRRKKAVKKSPRKKSRKPAKRAKRRPTKKTTKRPSRKTVRKVAKKTTKRVVRRSSKRTAKKTARRSSR